MRLQEAVELYQKCQFAKYHDFIFPDCDNCQLTAKITKGEDSPTVCDALDVISEIRQEVEA